MKLDWRVSVTIIVINLLGVVAQYAVNSYKIEELFRMHNEQVQHNETIHQQQEDHLKAIDTELRVHGEAAGQAKEFHDETIRRLDSIDRKLDRRLPN